MEAGRGLVPPSPSSDEAEWASLALGAAEQCVQLHSGGSEGRRHVGRGEKGADELLGGLWFG